MENLKNTQTVYSKPSKQSQLSYYSKHGAKKQSYRLARFIVQAVWFIVAFVGLTNILRSSLSDLPQLSHFVPIVSALLVFFLHNLLSSTASTYFYDKLDDDPDTDSSPIIPIFIALSLIAMDYYGAKKVLSSMIKPIEYADRDKIDSRHNTTLNTLASDFEKEKTEIKKIYAQKRSAASAPFQREINRLNKVQVISDNDSRWVLSRKKIQEAKMDAALYRIQEAEAVALEKAIESNRENKATIKKSVDAAVDAANTKDGREISRFDTKNMEAKSFSYVISITLAILWGMFLYAEIRINCKSGILPQRAYTNLDAHGGFIEKLFRYVVLDVWQRASHNVLVTLHNKMAVRNLRDFDGHYFEADSQSAHISPTISKKIFRIVDAEPIKEAIDKSDDSFTHMVLLNEIWTGSSKDRDVAVFDKRHELFQKGFETKLSETSNMWTVRKSRGLTFEEMMRQFPTPPHLSNSYSFIPYSSARNTAETERIVVENVPHCATVTQQEDQPQRTILRTMPDTSNLWLKANMDAIKKEPGNLTNPAAKKETVAGRMSARVGALHTGFSKGQFTPDIQNVKSALQYLEDRVVPAINERSVEVKRLDDLILSMKHYIAQH